MTCTVSPLFPARPARPRNGIRGWLFAVLTLVGLLVFGATSASAADLPAAQTRVRVPTPETITAVGVSEHIAAGQGRGPPFLAAGIVVATGVATKSEVPAANATVRDLLKIEKGNNAETIKSGLARNRSDQQLLDSVFKPYDDVYMQTYRDGVTLMEGNHRRCELLKRARDPQFTIQWDTPIFIKGFGGQRCFGFLQGFIVFVGGPILIWVTVLCQELSRNRPFWILSGSRVLRMGSLGVPMGDQGG